MSQSISARRHLLQQGGAALLGVGFPWLGLPAGAYAQTTWPIRPLRAVVPFPPGGTTDHVTRLVMQEVARAVGQPVVVENKPGAGTVIGVDTVAKSTSDGYSFVTVANSFAANVTLVKKLPYDALKDLRPVALMGMSEHVLATHSASGIRSLADLRSAASKSSTLSYASFGNGTSAHLSGAALALHMGLPLVHVPYKGQAPALNDLLGGQVTLMFGNWPEFRAHVQSGRLVAVGMATAKRSVYAPDISTLAEQGVAIESNSWNGLLAPSGTPDAVVQRLNAEVNKALATAPVVEAFRQGGIASLSGTPERFAAFIRSEIDKYAQVIRQANISLES